MTVPTTTLQIRLSSGARFDVTFQDAMEQINVSLVKDKISTLQEDCPPERQRLIYKGRILADDRTLSDYGVVNGATLHLVKSAAAATANRASTTTSTTTTTTTTTAFPTAPAPAFQSQQGMMPPNPFAAFAAQQQQQQQQQEQNPFGGMPMPPPEQMQEMMNSPMMQSLMDNPELMRGIMEANPQMRQLMQENPQLREVMNNPEMLRQSMEMMRNPSAMQHMMRSQDLAMSQLENMPGGFAALSSMYRNVQEPMMDAAQPQETPTQRNSSGQSGATGAAMPNPWGSSITTTAAPSNPTTNPAAPFGSMTAAPNPWGNNNNNNDMMMGGGGYGSNPFGANNPFGGGAPNPQQMEQTLQMLENPMMAQMMDQMLQQNPEMIAQMMAQNPMMQQMQRENPHMAQMMSSPEFLRQMMNPTTLRTMMQLQQSMGGGSMPPNMPPNMGGSMPPNMGGMGWNMPPSGSMPPMDFSNLLNQFQSTGLQSQQPQQAPADRFRVQLQSLRDMGFDDEMANVSALQQNHGNLNRAVDYLLMNPTIVSSAPAPSSSSSSAPVPSSDTAPTDGGDAAAAADETTPSQDNNAAPEEPKDNADKKND